MRKFIISIILIFFFFNAKAQSNNKIDSIYYLIDTLHTPVNDNMWDIQIDKVSMCKLYSINCPCLIDGGTPTFIYSIEKKDNGIHVKKKDFKNIKLVTLSKLIIKAKQIENKSYKHNYQIFFIEPNGKTYIIHEVMFTNPKLKIVSPPDFIEKKIESGK